MPKTLPIIFFGSSDFSFYVLREFLKEYKPILVLTLKPKPQGRGLKIKLSKLYKFCLKEKINIFEFENWGEFKETVEKIKPKAGLIAGFGKIIPKEIIDIFPKGILNVHPSILPKYRGPNPIREAILNGEKETGVTIFSIDALIDHGPIIKQEKVKIKNENYLELEEKLGRLGGKLSREIILDYLEGKIKGTKQDESLATYTRKINKEDGLLSLEDNFENWDRKIRALNPWPGTFIYLKSQNRDLNEVNINKAQESVASQNKYVFILKIFQIEKIKEGYLPQEIKKIKIGNFFEWKNELCLRLKDSFIFLKEVQLEGRKKMSGKEFLNGFRRLLFKD